MAVEQVEERSRNCPTCGNNIVHVSKFQMLGAVRRGSSCKECGYKKNRKSDAVADRTRVCTFCGTEVIHTTRGEKLAAERCGKKCRKCFFLGWKQEIKPEELKRNCPDCGIEITYSNKYSKTLADEGNSKCVNCRQPKGEKSKMYKFKHSPESRAKMVQSQLAVDRKGEKNPMYGVHRYGVDSPSYGTKASVETKAKMSAVRKGVPKPPGFNQSEETKAKQRVAQKERHKKDPTLMKRMLRNSCKHPNNTEKYIEQLLDSLYPGEYKFTGNGDMVIDGMCPDFININGQKKIIEVFGEHVHDPKSSIKPVPYTGTEEGRKEAFSKFGYRTLVLWYKEIYRSDSVAAKLENLKNKIKAFHEA